MNNDELKKKIEEMKDSIICAAIVTRVKIDDRSATNLTAFAEKIYAAGYRKQSDVAENIIAMLRAAKPVVKAHFEAYDELIENIAAEYGVEVEKRKQYFSLRLQYYLLLRR